jgi:hypothetical protein
MEYTWHILETNDKLQKVGFKSYIHIEKSTWKLFLQWIFLKWIHNNEEVCCFLSFKLKDWMYNNFVIGLVLFLVSLTSRLPRTLNYTFYHAFNLLLLTLKTKKMTIFPHYLNFLKKNQIISYCICLYLNFTISILLLKRIPKNNIINFGINVFLPT